MREALVWWVVLMACWIATLAALTAVQLLVGAVAAVIGAAVGVAARRALGRRWSFDPRWVRWLALVPVAALVQTAALPTLLVRGRRARAPGLRRLPAPRDEDAARAAGHRALGAGVLSAAPGSYLVDWPADAEHPVVLHTILTAGPDLERGVLS